MLYRRFPGMKEEVSALGFGFMRLPLIEGSQEIDEERAMDMVAVSLDAGVNYWDTAWPYHGGASEPFVGRALKRFSCRDRVFLATKSPVWEMKVEGDWERILDLQLKRLGVDMIDFYLVHALSAESWEKTKRLKGIEALERAKADGRIRHLGFSFHDGYAAFEKILCEHAWEFCQIQYNYLDVERQAGLKGLELAASKGIGVIVMEPLRGGGLANGVPPEAKALFGSQPVPRMPAEWALRFVLDHPGVVTALSGMTTKEQLIENCATASAHKARSLTPDHMAMFSKARAIFEGKIVVPCTACKYCMPCPQGVDIPGVFDIRNTAAMFGEQPKKNWWYSKSIVPGGSGADKCVACGQCEPKCPQGIGIIEALKEAHEYLYMG